MHIQKSETQCLFISQVFVGATDQKEHILSTKWVQNLAGRQTSKLSIGVPQSESYHCASHSLVTDWLTSLNISATQKFLPFTRWGWRSGGLCYWEPFGKSLATWKLRAYIMDHLLSCESGHSGMPLKIIQQAYIVYYMRSMLYKGVGVCVCVCVRLYNKTVYSF